ncbi:hypothetical protein CYPRO_3233 [Cyclonatronum proteinivorum]|uniref:SH3 domain-containing protein n=1 Tax=Cyclonatronum proteinivorum TaxID=1457365 RepID=A0A345UPR4_9BACT|nr:SH3 domain-containing protein [Cyclonatronum proteinivorum]AXJ02466.1 hypothetical protein CYPRO_3233 [Cyclonatronum proteinivorum]
MYHIRLLFLFILYLFVVLFPAASTGYATASNQDTQHSIADIQMLFNEGNFYFQENNYREALQRYNQIEAAGFSSGPLFLNMALAHNRLDEPGLALFYFREASSFSNVRSEAVEGSEYISERLFQRFGEIPLLNTWQWRHYLIFKAGTTPFLIITLVLFNLIFLGWAAQWFYPVWRTRLRYMVLFAFLALLPFTAVTYWLWTANDRLGYGQIVQENISLRESPGLQSRVLLEVTPGFRFMKDEITSEEHPGYLKVELSNGMSGWIPAESARMFSRY